MADIEDRTKRWLVFSITPDCELSDEQIHALLVAALPADEEIDPDLDGERQSRT